MGFDEMKNYLGNTADLRSWWGHFPFICIVIFKLFLILLTHTLPCLVKTAVSPVEAQLHVHRYLILLLELSKFDPFKVSRNGALK